MLESYSLSCKEVGGVKDYKLKFKVVKGVQVTFSQVGDIHKVDLKYVAKTPGGDHTNNYKITGPLKLQFFQYPLISSAKSSVNTDPVLWPGINIEP